MNPIQDERAKDFIAAIDREVDLEPNDNGFELRKPGNTRIGFVRFNISGEYKDKYRVYAYMPFTDPRGMFTDGTCAIIPNNYADICYAISVLESSYD